MGTLYQLNCPCHFDYSGHDDEYETGPIQGR